MASSIVKFGRSFSTIIISILFLFYSFSMVESIQNDPINWNSATPSELQQQQSKSSNPQILGLSSSSLSSSQQDKLDKLYEEVLNRLLRTNFNNELAPNFFPDLETDKIFGNGNEDNFKRTQRHLRFGKRFNARAKYSDLDYGHMRFGKR